MTTSYDYTSSARKKTPPGKETSVEKPAAAEATPPPAPAAPAKPEEKPKPVATPPAVTADKTEKKEKKKGFSHYSRITISVILALILSLVIFLAGKEMLKELCLPVWLDNVIIFLTTVLLFGLIGFAVNFITPAKNTNFAKSVILGVALWIITSMLTGFYRKDFHDPLTGEPSVWVTEGLQEYWFEKPDFVFSPITGKPVRLATREEIPKLPKRGISFNFFKKEPPPPPPPPPSWKTVFKKDYQGAGYGPNDYVYTAEQGKDVCYGDRIVFIGQEFETWHKGGFKRFNGRFEIINKNTSSSGKFAIKAPVGKNVTVAVERLE